MATINDFGIPGVGISYAEPKRRNRWRVTFGNLGGGVSSQSVSSQAVKVSKPSIKFDEVTLHRYTQRAYVAGKYEWEPLSLTVEDDVTGATATVIQSQLQKEQWIIGAEGQWLAQAGEGSLYKFVTYLEQLDGNDQVIERWTYEGCWFTSVKWGDLDYAEGNQVTIDLSIRFDHARQSIGGYTQGQGVALGGLGRQGSDNNA